MKQFLDQDRLDKLASKPLDQVIDGSLSGRSLVVNDECPFCHATIWQSGDMAWHDGLPSIECTACGQRLYVRC